MILITGGAGFIGSNVAMECEKRHLPFAIIDDFSQTISKQHKWMNIRKLHPHYVLSIEDTEKYLDKIQPSAIVHMGAISDTTADDFCALLKNNIHYTQSLWRYACERNIAFIYASSAATYGDGEHGFDAPKTCEENKKFIPLNAYGWSKLMIDHFILDDIKKGQKSLPPFWAGLRFFNVYGPNEYHKGKQSSVVPTLYHQICETGQCKLFASDRETVADGMQMRDFIYVKDCAQIIMNMIDHPSHEKSGIYNVGTQKARSFCDMAKAIFAALDKEENITYIPTPENLKQHYQYYTQAGSRNIDYHYTSLEDGVKDYVTHYLEKTDVYR